MVEKLPKKVKNLPYLLCWSVFVPQITGGPLPPGPVREKVSVRQLLAAVTENEVSGSPTSKGATYGTAVPPTSAATMVSSVVGPAITKVFKSSRI